MKYAADCDAVFGYFLHHFPYIGLRGEDDEAAHHRVGQRMKELYEETFGIAYGSVGAGTAFSGVAAKSAFSGVATKAAFSGVAPQAAFSGVAPQTAFSGVAAKSAFSGVASASTPGAPSDFYTQRPRLAQPA